MRMPAAAARRDRARGARARSSARGTCSKRCGRPARPCRSCRSSRSSSRARSRTGCAARSKVRCAASPSRSSATLAGRRARRGARARRTVASRSSGGSLANVRSRCSRGSSRAARPPTTTCIRGSCTSRGWSTVPCARPSPIRSPTRAGAADAHDEAARVAASRRGRGRCHRGGGPARDEPRQRVRRAAAHRAPARRARHRRAAAHRRERRAVAVGADHERLPARSVAPWSTRVGSIDDLAARARSWSSVAPAVPTRSRLLALARARDLDVVAVYVDHGLRAGHRSRRAGRRRRGTRSVPRCASSPSTSTRAPTSRPARATRATRRSSRSPTTRTRRRSSWGTRATTRPRPCCWRCCAGAAPRAWPGCRRSEAASAGRCSGCAAPRPTRSARVCGGRRCAIR